jgi:subfamily B ATP-binding cassette protein MsbA
MLTKETSTIGKSFSLLRRIGISPWYLLVPVLLAILAAVFEGFGMGLLIPLFSGFLQKNFSFVHDTPVLGTLMRSLPESLVTNDRLLFGLLIGGFIVLFVLRNTLKFLTAASVSYFSARTLHHLRKTIFTKYLSFGKLFFDRSTIGYHSVLLMEFSQNAIAPVQGMDTFIGSLFSLTVYLVVMFFISWKLTLAALPLFILLHFAIREMVVRIKALSRTLAARGNELGKKSVEILSTIPLVKSSRMEHQEQKLYATISDAKARLDFRVRALQAVILPLQEVITLLVVAAIFAGVLLWFGRDQVASASALVVYFYIIVNASGKFGNLSGFRGTLAAASAPLDEVLRVFDDREKFVVHGGNRTFTGLREAIDFRRLSFSYLEDREILRDVSLRVQKGKMTALVGPTGAGKSTIVHLLMRYYDCPPGSILLDGVDLRESSLDSYLKRLALVSQETLLLHDSLRANITYGLENVSEETLREAVRRARLDEYVRQLPEGLDTLIGDRGVKLSGGEKQRVSIARALLRDAEILILDEATSSLDSQTEKFIQEAIDEVVRGRTSIVIAHRLSTIRNADRIVVLHEGKVEEEGTFDELVERKGMFYRLWEGQKF